MRTKSDERSRNGAVNVRSQIWVDGWRLSLEYMTVEILQFRLVPKVLLTNIACASLMLAFALRPPVTCENF